MAAKLKAFGQSNDPLEHRFVIRNAAGDTYNGTTYIAWDESNVLLYRTLASLNGSLKGEKYFVADEPTDAKSYDLFYYVGASLPLDAYPVSSGEVESIYQFEEPSAPPELYIPSPYVTVESADAYFATKLNTTAWDSASDPNKQLALNDATRFVNQFAYIGTKTVSTQDNEWPRSGILDQDELVTPQRILFAIYEIAYAYIRGVDSERELKGANVTARGYSSVRTTYDSNRVPEYVLYGCPSGVAWLYLLPYLDRDSSGIIRLHRVN